MMSRETVLITGASSGIGLELARLFAADGSDLVLVARRRERLEELSHELEQSQGIAAEVLVEDLASAAAPQAIFDRLQSEGRTIDVLVNNAGFGAVGPVVEIGLGRQLEMLQVNVVALAHLTMLFLPGMLQRGRGGVLNVGSTAAFQPGPYMAMYYASKAFVLSFSEALAEELRGTPVRVCCLCPGPTRTEFAAAAHIEDRLLFKLPTTSATQVARAGYRGFRRGKPLVIPGVVNKLGALAVRLTPRALVRKVTKRLQE
jgi:short-subunit dehydrogenase